VYTYPQVELEVVMDRQTAAIVTAVLLVVATVAVPLSAVAQSDGTATPTETTGDETAENDTADVLPGERLQGVVAVQEAELDGEIRTRAFGIRVAKAASDEARAAVVAEELNDTERRLAELEERKERLRERREAGNISQGRYRAEMAKLATETDTVRTIANESANASAGIPSETLEEKGINATAIRMLSERANDLTGPEVSRIARSIAGPSVASERRGPPENVTDRGPPENVTDRGDGAPRTDEADHGPPGNETDRGPPDDRPDGARGDEPDGSGAGAGESDGSDDAGSDRGARSLDVAWAGR
jgi:PAS domain-containing protein